MASIQSMIRLFGLAAFGVAAFEIGHNVGPGISLISNPLSVKPVSDKISSNQGASKQTPVTSLQPTTSSIPTTLGSTSYNWAGLDQIGTHLTSVSATWKAPSFTHPASSNRSIAEWVGLGGIQSRALIQVGTITSPNANGSASTTVFWEKLPRPAIQTVTIPAGATVTAKITPVGKDQWRLWLSLGGNSSPLINKVVTLSPRAAAAVETSADWITEAPSTQNGVSPLAPVASTTMSQVSANGVPLSAMDPQSLQTVGLFGPRGRLLAAPSSTSGSSNQLVVNTIFGSLPKSVATATNAPGVGFGSSNGWGSGYGVEGQEGGYPSNSGEGTLPGSGSGGMTSGSGTIFVPVWQQQ